MQSWGQMEGLFSPVLPVWTWGARETLEPARSRLGFSPPFVVLSLAASLCGQWPLSPCLGCGPRAGVVPQPGGEGRSFPQGPGDAAILRAQPGSSVAEQRRWH